MDQYAGSPSSNPATVALIDDSDAPNQANFRVGPQNLADRTAYVQARMAWPGAVWKSAWASTTVATAPDYIGAAAWDPLTSRWLLGTTDDPSGGNECTAYVSYGLDKGAGFASLGGASGQVKALGVRFDSISGDGTNVGTYWAGLYENPAAELFVTTLSTPNWTSKRLFSSAGGYASLRMAGFGGRIVVGVGSATAANSFLTSSADGGGTWQDVPLAAGVAVSYWRFAQSGTLLVAVPYTMNASATGGQSYYTSTDGMTWTTRSMASVVVGTQQVVGVAWDAQRSLWILAIKNSSTTSAFYSSPDAITWTAIGGLITATVADMAIFCGDYVCTLLEALSTGPSSQIFSIDGGNTWWPGQATFGSNAADPSTFWQPPQFAVAGAPFGLFAFNTLFGRFSHLAGLPASHL